MLINSALANICHIRDGFQSGSLLLNGNIFWQVVPTEYRYSSKDVLATNQYSVTEYFSPINEFSRMWPGKNVSIS